MRFVVEIEDLFESQYDGETFTKEELMEKLYDDAIHQIAKEMTDNMMFKLRTDNEINRIAREIVADDKDVIVNKVIDKIAANISAKKELKEITPKMSEIKAIDKQWEEYFSKLIDKCMKKKFG